MKKYKLVVIFFLIFFKCFAADYSIVFIHIGKQIPNYLKESIDQAALFNNCNIYVIANEKPLATFSKNFTNNNIVFVSCEKLTSSEEHKQFNKKFVLDKTSLNYFWKHTTERFFYLDELISTFHLKNIFHLESDVMLYADLAKELSIFINNYENIGLTFENEERVVPGFVYIANEKASNDLTKYISSNVKDKITDMEILALYQKQNNQKVSYLPIIPSDYSKKHELVSIMNNSVSNPENFSNNVDQFNSIFDAAALGQYLGGVDVFHGNSRPGFIDVYCIFDPSHFSFYWKEDTLRRKVPYIVFNKKEYRINNLHIHSKRLLEFSSSLDILPTVKGKKVLIPILNGEQLKPDYRKPSLPYVTGDAFRSISDHIFDETHQFIIPKEVKKADVIFVKTDLLEDFFYNYHKKIHNPYILITHNSDDETPNKFEKYLDDKKIIAWFSQNVIKKHPKLIPIPIGIDNRYWGNKKFHSFRKIVANQNMHKKNKLLYQNFCKKTCLDKRSYVQKLFENKKYCITKSKVPIKEYCIDVTTSNFVLSPRGNGLDTLRTWESLYLGSFPIVESSAMDSIFDDLPVIIVNDYNEVNEKFLHDKLQEMENKEFNMEKIYFPYWENLIHQYKNKALNN